MRDLKEAVSALIYTLTAKDNKVWANIQLTLLQINLETALGKFDSIKIGIRCSSENIIKISGTTGHK